MAFADPAHIYTAEYSTKLQEALDEANKFKDICDVRYTSVRTFTNPYGTDTTITTPTGRGCPYTLTSIQQTTESLTVSQFSIVPEFIDRADLAQCTFQNQMDIAYRQGVILNERIENRVYYQLYYSGTDFGTEGFTNTAGSTAITVSTTNIDDIIRGVKREIREAAGESLADRNGIYFVWRPADLEMLEQVMQANGFVIADRALENGVTQGIKYMGCTHWSSGQLTAAHVVAGVKKCATVGILKETYGQIVITQDPELRSGVGIISRVDFGVELWYNFRAITFDVNVV